MLPIEMQVKLAVIVPHGTNVTQEQMKYRNNIKKQQKRISKLNKIRIQTKSRIANDDLREFFSNRNVSRFGVCRLEPKYFFESNNIPSYHEIGIVFGFPMSYDKMKTVPSVESATEVLRLYSKVGNVVVQLTEWLQNRGIDAMGHHPLGDDEDKHQLLIPPYAYLSGLGEQGRTGLFIDHKLGPLVRLGMISTNLSLDPINPIIKGINAFCQRCQYCIKYCPPRAIPQQVELPIFNETTHFEIDGEKCIKYFEKHYGCGKCLVYCVLAKSTQKAIDERMHRINVWYERWILSGELALINQENK